MELDIGDNWGVVEPSELFLSTGKTQSLRFLVDQLAKNDEFKKELDDKKNVGKNLTNGTSKPWRKENDKSFAVMCDRSLQTLSSSISSGDIASSKVVKAAPKILKQKRGIVADKPPNLKRVTFEVEKFVVDNLQAGVEKESAAAQMAIRLGAKPLKPKAVNYKQLKSERQQRGNSDQFNAGVDFLRSLSNNSKKVQKNKKKNRRNKNAGKKMTKKQLKKAKKK